MKKALIFGSTGQLGGELLQRYKGQYHLYTPSRFEADFTKPELVRGYIHKIQPHLVINAAGMTDVDGCESNTVEANLVNAVSVENMCEACNEIKARLVHLSTDYVFNGTQRSPYEVESNPDPINVYGVSKRKAENAVLGCLNAVVIRTSWLYSFHGNNFLKTMLRLMNGNEPVRVVSDQVGAPTSVKSLADFVVKVSESSKTGLYHWSDEGEVSWFQFATEIQRQALEQGLLKSKVELIPIRSVEYPFVAARPAYSVLNLESSIHDFEIRPIEWRKALSQTFQQMPREVA